VTAPAGGSGSWLCGATCASQFLKLSERSRPPPRAMVVREGDGLSGEEQPSRRGLRGFGESRWFRSVLSSLRVISRLASPCRDGGVVLPARESGAWR